MTITIHKDIIQGTPEWHKLRAGKLTASCIDQILTPSKLEFSKQSAGYAAQIAVERITGKCVDGVKTSAMQKGNDLEPIARQIYHEEFYPVYEAAFMENSAVAFPFGASPDALHIDGKANAEIKCLSNPTEYFDLLTDGIIKADRKLQMAGQHLAGGLEYTDFVIYIEGMKMKPVRYHRDESLIAKIITAGALFEEMVQSFIAYHDASEGFLTPVYEEVYDSYE